jgi:hypothetical protein
MLKEARLENVMWKYYVTLVLTQWGIRFRDQISISTKVTWIRSEDLKMFLPAILYMKTKIYLKVYFKA